MERLFADIWGRPGESPIVADVLMALVHSGNYVAGAHLDGGLVGGLVGWLGGSPPDHLLLHSHILGVVAEGRGLGGGGGWGGGLVGLWVGWWGGVWGGGVVGVVWLCCLVFLFVVGCFVFV